MNVTDFKKNILWKDSNHGIYEYHFHGYTI